MQQLCISKDFNLLHISQNNDLSECVRNSGDVRNSRGKCPQQWGNVRNSGENVSNSGGN